MTHQVAQLPQCWRVADHFYPHLFHDHRHVTSVSASASRVREYRKRDRMDVLYPNLHDRFKSEGICPICLMEMELTPRYSCVNGHTLCHRCKPYYYNCPTCQSPLDLEVPPVLSTPPHMPPPPTHYMPHPYPPQYQHERTPSAPPLDFLEQERQHQGPPTPPPNQQLIPCSYTQFGCWVKTPDYLREIHESRCQFRPHLEDEHLPTDLNHDQDDLVPCTYSVVGCKMRTTPWRRSVHEKYCIYKSRYDSFDELSEGLETVSISQDSDGEPNELVECKFRRYGCMVNMPRRRKSIHEEKCNYQKYYNEEDYENEVPSVWVESEPDVDPEEQTECRWAANGCQVRPKWSRKEMHEEKCNYRMEECVYKDSGCTSMFLPSRRYAHEKSCEYAC